MAIESMEDLLVQELQEIYSAERLAVRAYPRLRREIETASLLEAVERHTEQTKEQIERLGKIFELMDARTRGKTCHAMQGLVEEAQEHAESDLDPELLEVMLVADLQKIEHFEIAAYGSARAHAEALGMREVVELLDETLREEKETDNLLNRIAVEEINPQAVAEIEEESEEEEEEEAEGEQDRTAQGRRRSGGKSRSGPGESDSSARSSEDDLRSREYRDRQGNEHHHTRTSGARQRK